MDFYRFRLKTKQDLAEIKTLIEVQAQCFLALYGKDAVFDYNHTDEDEAQRNQRISEKKMLADDYGKASAELRAFLDFPAWDISSGIAKDISYLAPCFRVNPIFDNPAFPPPWRTAACRTYLPTDVQPQIVRWKQWSQQVADGQHIDYLRHLHAFETSKILWKHWDDQHFRCADTLNLDGAWVFKPKFVKLRKKILAMPEPKILPVPNAPDQDYIGLSEEDYQAVFDAVRLQFEISRRWNSISKGFSKCQYSAGHYLLDFEAFKAEAHCPWVQDFLQWTDKCVRHQFGLFLDY